MKLDNIISNAIFKSETLKNVKEMSIVDTFIKSFCKEKLIIISKFSKSDQYILYSFDPYIQSLELCKELYEYMKYLKLITSVYQKEFIIMNIYKPFIIIRSALVNRPYMMNLHINDYPDFLYAIFQYKDLYNYKNCKQIYNNTYNLSLINDTDVIKICNEKNIPLSDSHIDTIHNSFYKKIIEELYIFLDGFKDIIFLDAYAYQRLKGNNIKFTDVINFLYPNILEISYAINNKIKDYMKSNYSDEYRFEIFIRQYNNMNFDDFRLIRTMISLRYFNNDFSKTIELTNFYNSLSYDPIPIYNINDAKFPHEFVYKRFSLIMLCILFIYKPYEYKNRISNIIRLYNKYNPFSKDIQYVGTFRMESYDKKIFNKDKNAYPYIPYNDKNLNNIMDE